MIRHIIAALTLSALATAALAAPTTSRKLVCWTDEKGVRSCGDHVPPQYVKGDRDVLDAQGRVTNTQSREKTPEEVQAEEDAKRLAVEMEARKKRQAEYDRFLLDTYNTEKDLARARDDRVGTLDGRIKLIRQTATDNETTLKQLKTRAAAQAEKSKNGAVDPKLTRQVETFEKAVADSRDAMQQLEQEREAIRKKFDDDIARWKQLKSGGG
jgi:hypothetical protein